MEIIELCIAHTVLSKYQFKIFAIANRTTNVTASTASNNNSTEIYRVSLKVQFNKTSKKRDYKVIAGERFTCFYFITFVCCVTSCCDCILPSWFIEEVNQKTR